MLGSEWQYQQLGVRNCGDEMEEELNFSFHESLAPLYADFEWQEYEGDGGYAEEKMVEEGGEDWNKFKLG